MKKIIAFVAVSLMAFGAFACCSMVSDDSSAADCGSPSAPLDSLSGYIRPYFNQTVYVKVGGSVNLIGEYCTGPQDFWCESIISGAGHGLVKSGYNITGTISSAGTTVFEIIGLQGSIDGTLTIVGVVSSFTVSFNANGGSTSASPNTVSGGTVISLPSASKSYCTFSGWYTAANGGTRIGGAGDSYTVNGNITLYAQYNVVPVSITTSQGTAYIVQGTSFAYTVGTSPADASVSVSGANWLTVSNKTVTGVPTASIAPAGTYHITVTASYGTQFAVQSFDIVVVEKLIFESIPTGGIIATPV